ncbi:MAG: protein kinase, partial [Planctomycetota bacterium]
MSENSPPPADAASSSPSEPKLDAGLAAAFGPTSPENGADLSVLESIARVTGRAPKVLLRDDSSPGAASPLINTGPREKYSVPVGKGNYQVLGEIARGGMGVVMKGHDLDLGRDVALKVLHENLASDPAILERFVEEAQIGAQLQHPGIVPVYDLGLMADDRPYFTMKLVKGRTLSALLGARKNPAEDRRRFIAMFEQVCLTMAYAHSRGVIHRDLKPSNVMVGAFGEVQVVDWGLAKVLRSGSAPNSERTHAGSAISVIATVRSGDASDGSASLAGSVLGTPSYMPPEQARGNVDELNERADVFSLGAVLAEILTGKPPYIGGRDMALTMATRANQVDCEERLEACGADPELVELCRECLSPALHARPADAGEVAQRIASHLASLEERTRSAEVAAAESRVRAADERRARRLTLGLAASILGTVVLGGAGWAWVEKDRSQRLRETTSQVDTALEEANIARGADDWTGALAAAERALALAQAGGSPVLEERARDLGELIEGERDESQSDEKLAAANEEILATLHAAHRPATEISDLGWEERDALHQAAFHAAGLTPDEGSEDVALEELRVRGIPEDLATEVDAWTIARAFTGDRDGAGRLARIAKRLDPDPLRDRLRDLIPVSNVASLRKLATDLARAEDVSQYSVSTLAILSQTLGACVGAEEAIELLEVATAQHPGEFSLLIAMGSAHLLGVVDEPQEALLYLYAARALRPENAAVWGLIGEAYCRMDLEHQPRAVAAFHRALQLDSDQPRALAGIVTSSFYCEPEDRPSGDDLV